jgi:polysaccharide pyruvyl transferase WcaK-like protein
MATQCNVLIVGGYARQNAGDAALLHAIIQHAERAFPGCLVNITGMEDPRRHRYFEGVRNLGSMRRYADDESISRFRRAARRALVLAIGMSWFVAPARWYRWVSAWLPAEVSAELAAIERADLLVSLVVAGGYLQGAARPGLGPRVIYQLLPLILAERLGTPVVCAPQSYGPFDSKLVAWIVARTLRPARLVLAREDISLAELRKLRLPADVACRAVDSAFSLEPPGPVRADQLAWRASHGVGATDVLVGVTVRRCLSPVYQASFEAELAAFVDRVHDLPGHRVVIFPQATAADQRDDDRIASRAVARLCRGRTRPILLETEADYRGVASFIAGLDYLVGNRFHSVIFALTARVPCIAIGYEHKTQGIMRDLSLDGWGLPAQDLSAASLYALFEKLEKHRSAYRAHLNHVIPGYVARGRAVTGALARAYYGAPAAAENENMVTTSTIGYEEDCHICRESVVA